MWLRWMGSKGKEWRPTFKSTISLSFDSNSFFTVSAASPFFLSASAAAASSFLDSDPSEEYHLEAVSCCRDDRANDVFGERRN